MNKIYKRTQAALAATALLALMSAPVLAADAVMEEPPAPAAPVEDLPVASWTGPYAGIYAGYGFAGSANTAAEDIDTKGFVGGGFAGYQVQNGSIVYGVEGDIGYKGFDEDGVTANVKTGLEGSLRARLGYSATPDLLIYGTAGGTAQNLEVTDVAGSDKNAMVGYTVGAGVDYKFTETVFGRAEYRYSDYGSKDFNTGSGLQSVDSSDHRVTFGVGMKF